MVRRPCRSRAHSNRTHCQLGSTAPAPGHSGSTRCGNSCHRRMPSRPASACADTDCPVARSQHRGRRPPHHRRPCPRCSIDGNGMPSSSRARLEKGRKTSSVRFRRPGLIGPGLLEPLLRRFGVFQHGGQSGGAPCSAPGIPVRSVLCGVPPTRHCGTCGTQCLDHCRPASGRALPLRHRTDDLVS
jgi:hypothetical protein